ncbi:hypothetical protein AY633_00390 [Planococcus maritimus]|nr:hypothetical protein AY633_00390 [Planococcus maritimus]
MMSELFSVAKFYMLLILNIGIGTLGFIPSILITPINLDRFGLIGGSALSVVGEIFGALIGFCLYRYGAKHLPSAWQQQQWFQFFLRQKNGAVFFAVIAFRLLPFAPSGAVTAAAALTTISAPAFFWASSIGKLPALALEITLAFGMVFWLPQSLLYGVIGVGFVGMLLMALKRKRSSTKLNRQRR